MAAYYYSEKDDTVYKCTALTKEKDYTTVSMDAVVDADGDVMYELDGEAASVVESVEIKKYLAEMDTFKKFADFPLSHNIYGNNSHGAAAKAYRKKAEEYGRLIGKNAEMHTSETQDASGVRVMLEFAKTCFVARVFFEMFAAWFLTAQNHFCVIRSHRMEEKFLLLHAHKLHLPGFVPAVEFFNLCHCSMDACCSAACRNRHLLHVFCT